MGVALNKQPAPLWNLHSGEIIVDLFAGGGGASTGIFRALGRHPDVAVNHDPEALCMHEANHPETVHLVEDVWQVKPEQVARITGGKPVGLLWASPDCTHHSKAKGGKPRDRNARSLAWVVVWWAAKARPRVICLENVEEFAHWGPLDEAGQPVKSRKGEDFQRFVRRLEFYGYKVEHRELRADHYGAPTSRKRLFVVARCDGMPIVWPEPTHGPGRLPVRTAAEIIDWSIPMLSIFASREEAREFARVHGVGVPQRPLRENTLRRIAKGIRRFVLDNPRPFIVPISHFNGRDVAHDGLEPLRTITASPQGGDFALVAPVIATNTTGHASRPLSEPIPTLTTGGHHMLVAPALTRYNGAKTPEGDGRGQALDGSLSTLDTSNRIGLVTAFLAKHFGTQEGQMPSGLSPDQPLGTVTACDHHGLVAATLIQTGYGERKGQEPRVPGLGKPLGTVVAGGGKHGLVAAHLTREFGKGVGSRTDEPIQTIMPGGAGKSALVAAFLGKYYGTASGAAADEPMDTLTTRERFAAVTVQIDGETYAVVDIYMRMLSPRELFRGQGFSEAYIIDPAYKGKRLSKAAQVRMVGNSVVPQLAEALVRANLGAYALEGVGD